MKIVITLFLTAMSSVMLAQIPNPGFETWGGSPNNPNGWNTLNYLIAGLVTQSSTAHTGSSSASLNSVFAGGNYNGGYLQTGTSSDWYFASAGNPAALNGWYQLNSVSGDQFKVQLLAKDASGNIKGSATWDDSVSSATGIWKQFSACISYTGAADSAEILFTLAGTRSNSYTHNGSFTLIDDLTFGTCILGVEDVTNSVTLESAYPNPASGVCNIIFSLPKTSSVNVSLYDLGGRKVLTALGNTVLSDGRYKIPVDVHALANGVYAYTITVDGVPYTQKLVVTK